MNGPITPRACGNGADHAAPDCCTSSTAAAHRTANVQPPILIRALGRLTIYVHGAPMLLRRIRLRPIELLKCLLAAGPNGASRERLGDALWPDAEEGAQRALEINLHRLRRMLGRREAVVATDGHLALDSQLCWIDAIGFEQAAMRAEKSLQLDSGASIQPHSEEAMQALLLYTGHFLEHEPDHPWVLQQRERLRCRFVSMAERLARLLGATADTHAAIEIYRFALVRDPINEIFNGGLIDALHRAGRRAEAILAYRRFEQVTRAVHGSVPSERMRRLGERLGM